MVRSQGRLDEVEGFVADEGDHIIGLVTYRIDGRELEIVTIEAIEEQRRIGIRLLEAVEAQARALNCARIRLLTKDNLDVLRFYQRRGFTLMKVHRRTDASSRWFSLPLPKPMTFSTMRKDEIELEKVIAQ